MSDSSAGALSNDFLRKSCMKSTYAFHSTMQGSISSPPCYILNRAKTMPNEESTQTPAPPPAGSSWGKRIGGPIPLILILLVLTVFYMEGVSDRYLLQQEDQIKEQALVPQHEGLHVAARQGQAINGTDTLSTTMNIPKNQIRKWLEKHQHQLKCDFPYQKIDENCPRFVHMPVTPQAGLGNKFFTYIIGPLLAIDMKATYVYDGQPFTVGRDHGGYPW